MWGFLLNFGILDDCNCTGLYTFFSTTFLLGSPYFEDPRGAPMLSKTVLASA